MLHLPGAAGETGRWCALGGLERPRDPTSAGEQRRPSPSLRHGGFHGSGGWPTSPLTPCARFAVLWSRRGAWKPPGPDGATRPGRTGDSPPRPPAHPVAGGGGGGGAVAPWEGRPGPPDTGAPPRGGPPRGRAPAGVGAGRGESAATVCSLGPGIRRALLPGGCNTRGVGPPPEESGAPRATFPTGLPSRPGAGRGAPPRWKCARRRPVAGRGAVPRRPHPRPRPPTPTPAGAPLRGGGTTGEGGRVEGSGGTGGGKDPPDHRHGRTRRRVESSGRTARTPPVYLLTQPDSGKTRARRAGGRYRPHTVHGLGLDQKDLGPPRAAPGSGSSRVATSDLRSRLGGRAARARQGRPARPGEGKEKHGPKGGPRHGKGHGRRPRPRPPAPTPQGRGAENTGAGGEHEPAAQAGALPGLEEGGGDGVRQGRAERGTAHTHTHARGEARVGVGGSTGTKPGRRAGRGRGGAAGHGGRPRPPALAPRTPPPPPPPPTGTAARAPSPPPPSPKPPRATAARLRGRAADGVARRGAPVLPGRQHPVDPPTHRGLGARSAAWPQPGGKRAAAGGAAASRGPPPGHASPGRGPARDSASARAAPTGRRPGSPAGREGAGADPGREAVARGAGGPHGPDDRGSPPGARRRDRRRSGTGPSTTTGQHRRAARDRDPPPTHNPGRPQDRVRREGSPPKRNRGGHGPQAGPTPGGAPPPGTAHSPKGVPPAGQSETSETRLREGRKGWTTGHPATAPPPKARGEARTTPQAPRGFPPNPPTPTEAHGAHAHARPDGAAGQPPPDGRAKTVAWRSNPSPGGAVPGQGVGEQARQEGGTRGHKATPPRRRSHPRPTPRGAESPTLPARDGGGPHGPPDAATGPGRRHPTPPSPHPLPPNARAAGGGPDPSPFPSNPQSSLLPTTASLPAPANPGPSRHRERGGCSGKRGTGRQGARSGGREQGRGRRGAEPGPEAWAGGGGPEGRDTELGTAGSEQTPDGTEREPSRAGGGRRRPAGAPREPRALRPPGGGGAGPNHPREGATGARRRAARPETRRGHRAGAATGKDRRRGRRRRRRRARAPPQALDPPSAGKAGLGRAETRGQRQARQRGAAGGVAAAPAPRRGRRAGEPGGDTRGGEGAAPSPPPFLRARPAAVLPPRPHRGAPHSPLGRLLPPGSSGPFFPPARTSLSSLATSGPAPHRPARAARVRCSRADGARQAGRRRDLVNDPSAGSPTETLLRLLLPLDSQVRPSSQRSARAVGRPRRGRSEGLTKPSNRFSFATILPPEPKDFGFPEAARRVMGITPPHRQSASFMVGTTTVSDRLRTSDFRS
ncbi:collagen alpha-1(I) chain-like [Mustela erminea]|uniref:collagen alpha-1(I) chain-like n=1 Tax=Mustela erminea TaxID=36723 RepID=UPI00138756DF|nr:collagen alpha-1(I) chain-like [Mustela erminea]